MIIYKSVINSLEQILEGYSVKKYPMSNPLDEGEKNQILFKSDILAELGGNDYFGISGIAYGGETDESNEIYLIGNDLASIDKKSNYARFMLVNVDEKKLGAGSNIYKALRKIDYVSYHLNPRNIMVQISPFSKKETLLIGKNNKELSFKELGSYIINKYIQIDGVLSVKVLFVTDSSFDYKSLQDLATKSEAITLTLDHLVNKVKMDCNTCKLQPVCNEVEELYKKDFLS